MSNRMILLDMINYCKFVRQSQRQPQRRLDSEKGSEKEGGKGCGLTPAGDFLGRVPTFGS